MVMARRPIEHEAQLWIPVVLLAGLFVLERLPSAKAARRRRLLWLPGQVWLPLPNVRPPLPLYRPKFRAECADVPRPCPFVTCRHHLFLDVNPRNGVLIMNHGHRLRDLFALKHSCAIDVAELDEGRNQDGALALEAVGKLVGVTVNAVWVTELRAKEKLKPYLQENVPDEQPTASPVP